MKRSVIAALLSATLVLGAAGPAGADTSSDDALLARDALRSDLSGVPFYMTMIDRYANGDPRNDRGGLDSGTRLQHGFDPTDKQFFHGGDLAGLSSKVDYLAGLGIKALWVNPPFRNRWVVDFGSAAFAAYHGYAITDFTSFDPHFGTTEQMRSLVQRAHARGIKVFFDITAHYTADIITFTGPHPYRSLAEVPYEDAAGKPFDIEAMAGRPDFPELSAETSFPYRPVFPDPSWAKLKKPDWLNDPTLYHNRGDATVYEGEQLLYGDFFGLDDLMTEHPRVIDGMRRIYSHWIDELGIDGYRVDTTKHVNDKFWQAFAPAIKAHATAKGKKDFLIFGEVYSEDAELTSHYTTAARMQSVLDFPFQGAAREFLAGQGASGLAEVLRADDLYTDADSNAYSLTTFLGNHDMGRLATMLKQDLPDLTETEWLSRLQLGNELLYLWRGNPVVYYGDEQGFAGTAGDAEARQDMFPSKVPDFVNQDQVGTDATPGQDNFDPKHPLYRQLAQLAEFTAADPVWKRGNQVLRTATTDVIAFSRIDHLTGREFVVIANSSTKPQTLDVPVGADNLRYDRIRPQVFVASQSRVTSESATISVTVPPLTAAVYRSSTPIPTAADAPKPTLSTGETTQDNRTELIARLPDTIPYAQATFLARTQGQQTWTHLGTDDAAPYRVFADLTKLPGDGGRIELKVVAKDRHGRTGSASLLR